MTAMSLWWGAGGSVRTRSYYPCEKVLQELIENYLLTIEWCQMKAKTQGKDHILY